MVEMSRFGTVKGILAEGKLNYEKVFENIVNSLSEYITKAHLKSCVLGLSGGIDSCVCSIITKEACDKVGIPLIGISIPCSSNKEDENSSANAAGKEFCHEFYTENIQDLFAFTEKTCNNAMSLTSTNISQGNIKARLRMIYLYNIASIRGGMVISTGNFTENILGFCTLHGDICDLDIIGNLWKTEVYDLAQWLLEKRYKGSEALKRAIEITPTDGNGVSNSDLDQIAPGLSYFEVDNVLRIWYGLNDKIKMQWLNNHDAFNKTWALNALANGSSGQKPYTMENVERIIKRVLANEFKQKIMPYSINIFADGKDPNITKLA